MKSFRSYLTAGVGFAMLVTIIFLATGWGSAVAAQVTSVFVNNDASHPVPVHEQGTANVNIASSAALPVHEQQDTQLIATGTLSASNPAMPDINVSAYREIRIVHGAVFCTSTTANYLVEAIEGGEQYLVDGGDICSNPPNDVLQVPGRTIRIRCTCSGGDFSNIAVFGRTN
jgi:hypothetical protein